jgi:hypothetical protein
MSGVLVEAVRVVEAAGLRWTLAESDVPGAHGRGYAAAFVKGFDARTSAVIARRDDLDGHAAEPPYRLPKLAGAWRCGWAFAKAQEKPR